MQLVDPVHQFQIGIRHRAGLVVDAAPADPQQNGLSADAQLCAVVDHRFALGNRPAYLHAYANVPEARASIGRYIGFYNGRRPHSSLDGKTPDQAYFKPLTPVSMAA